MKLSSEYTAQPYIWTQVVGSAGLGELEARTPWIHEEVTLPALIQTSGSSFWSRSEICWSHFNSLSWFSAWRCSSLYGWAIGTPASQRFPTPPSVTVEVPPRDVQVKSGWLQANELWQEATSYLLGTSQHFPGILPKMPHILYPPDFLLTWIWCFLTEVYPFNEGTFYSVTGRSSVVSIFSVLFSDGGRTEATNSFTSFVASRIYCHTKSI